MATDRAIGLLAVGFVLGAITVGLLSSQREVAAFAPVVKLPRVQTGVASMRAYAALRAASGSGAPSQHTLKLPHGRLVAAAPVVTDAPVELPSVPEGTTSPTGFAMVGGLVIVTDETTAFRYIAAAIDPMFQHGQPNADDVLLRLMREQFPEAQWPPQQGSEAAMQWDFMRARVAAILERYHPTPTPRLRLVK